MNSQKLSDIRRHFDWSATQFIDVLLELIDQDCQENDVNDFISDYKEEIILSKQEILETIDVDQTHRSVSDSRLQQMLLDNAGHSRANWELVKQLFNKYGPMELRKKLKQASIVADFFEEIKKIKRKRLEKA